MKSVPEPSNHSTLPGALGHHASPAPISDDGRGIPARSAAPRRGKALGGMGLQIMRYRARTIGATLRIHSRKPHGARVLCILPRK